jgi:parallel beta-helix repeat protein
LARGITDGIYAVSLSVSTAINIHDELLFWPTSVSVGTVPLRTSVGALASSILPQTVRVTDFGSIGTTNDSTVVQAALDGVAEKGTVIFSAGTYIIDGISVNKAMTIIVEKGATLKYKANATSSTSMINVVADDVTFYIRGTIDGNRTNQTGTNLRAIHAFEYDRIIVDGCNRQGYVHSVKGHAIWLRSGDDLRIVSMRCDSGSLDPFYIEGASANLNRPVIEDCYADLSGEGAVDYGCAKIQLTDSTTARTANYPLIKNCWTKMAATATNVPIEMWAGTATPGQIKNGQISGCYAEGGGIGISFNESYDCAAFENVVYNPTDIGIELANCTRSKVFGNNVNGNSRTTTGISIDNQGRSGTGNRAYGNHIIGCDTRAIYSKGVQGSFQGTNSVISGNVIEQLVSGAHGIEGDPANGITITGNNIIVSGGAADGIVLYSGTSLFSIQSNNIHTGFNGILLTGCNNFTIDGNLIYSASATAGSAYALEQCNFGRAAGGIISGTFQNGANIVVNSSTVDYITVGGWIGPGNSGGSINLVVNGGAFGDHVTGLPINGWHPFSVISNPSFNKMTGAFTTWVYADGIISADPNSVISAPPGSRLTDVSNGTVWIKVSGTGNTGWKTPQATSVNTP